MPDARDTDDCCVGQARRGGLRPGEAAHTLERVADILLYGRQPCLAPRTEFGPFWCAAP